MDLLPRAAFVALALLGSCLAGRVGAAQGYDLRPTKRDGQPIRVQVTLEVGGDLTLAADGKTSTVPMSVAARFGYDELRLDDGANPTHRMSLRHYDQLDATIKTGSGVARPQLRDSRRLIVATGGEEDVHLLSPRGPLTRDELELIDIPANSLVLDELLPQTKVQTGQRWKPSDRAMARLLGLDAVGHTEVEGQLNRVDGGIAEIGLQGTLGGAIDGVASDIELKGKFLYDIDRQLSKTLILAIKEKRGIGVVRPGLDVVAKIKVDISPLVESKYLTASAIKDVELPKSSEAPPLEYRSDRRGFRFLYDRRWHIIREEPDLVVMRLVDRGDLIAQCNVAPATKSIDNPIELIQFQNDVQKGLGKLFGKFERARESTTDGGLRVLESIAVGEAEKLPIQWRYYLVHDRQGRGLTQIFTMEGPLVEEFGDQDRLLVESVEFMEPKVAAADADATTQ